MPESTLAAVFQATASRMGDAVALRTRNDEAQLTWSAYARDVRHVAAGLAALGVGHGSTVALMLTNRPEFHVVDTAAFHLGGVPWSIYNTYPAEQIEHLLGDAGTNVVVTEQALLPVLRDAATAAGVAHVVVVDGDPPDGVMSLDELRSAGTPGFDFEAAWRAVGPADLVTIIYTSGTTGFPKGVQLTHANVIAAIDSFLEIWGLPDKGRFVSWLPMAHIAERLVTHYAPMFLGSVVTTCPVGREIADYLHEVRPSYFFAVPRVWEKLKSAVDTELAAERDPERRRATEQALEAGRRRIRALERGETPDPLAGADEELLAGLRRRLGLDHAVLGVTGAAPCPYEVIEFFHAIGVTLAEVYGMSEATGVGSHNRVGDVRIGTVGPPMPGMEIRTAGDGEVLMRGPAVMAGYRNRPEETAQAVDADGWLHSGDIGTIDDDGFLRIVDRKKELIINSAGKNMSPVNIEAALKTSTPLIDQAVAVGDRKPFNVALITLEPAAARQFARDHGIAPTSTAALAQEPAIVEEVARGVALANERLARVEQIKRFIVLPAEWEPGGDELTPTQKLRRRPIAEKYASEIEALYESASTAGRKDAA